MPASAIAAMSSPSATENQAEPFHCSALHMNQTRSSGRGSAIAPMLTPHPPRRRDLIPSMVALTGAPVGSESIKQIGARAAGPIAHPGFERLCAVGQHVDPARDPIDGRCRDGRVARHRKNLRDAHSQCEQDGADAERARGAENNGGRARPGIACAQGRVRGTEIAKACPCLKADAVREFHQRSQRRDHELGQAAIRILFEHACRTGAEAEIALEGHESHAIGSPLRQALQPPHERCGFTYTRSPGAMPRTCEPTSATTPETSKPNVAGSFGSGKYGNHVE